MTWTNQVASASPATELSTPTAMTQAATTLTPLQDWISRISAPVEEATRVTTTTEAIMVRRL